MDEEALAIAHRFRNILQQGLSAHRGPTEIGSRLEFWLSGIMRHLPRTNKHYYVWCDGVELWRIVEASARTVKVAGVAIWARSDSGNEYVSPFEVEFHFSETEIQELIATILRFGHCDPVTNDILMIPYGATQPYDVICDQRPKENTDWAIAVELSN